MHSGIVAVESVANYCRNILLILKCYMHVIGQKASVRNHLYITMFVSEPEHWLIMNCGCKMPYDGS